MTTPKGFAVTTAIDRSDPAIDPQWSDILLAVRLKVIQINELREIADRLVGECDLLVQEAVDDGERYRDIARAADRSMPWVQTALRRLGVEGPRVRVMTVRAAEAKRIRVAAQMANPDIGPDDDLFPD